MTAADQLPLDCSGDNLPHRPDLDAGTRPNTEVASKVSVGCGHAGRSIEVTAPASAERVNERAEQTLAPQDVAASSESGNALNGITEGSDTRAAVSEPAVPAQALYFLTNRMNLNGVLSSRLVGPRESLHKYYTDLMDQTPGWVPLLRNAPTQAQIEMVTRERGAGAPVLVEFPIDILEKVKSDAPIAYAPAVAMSSAVAIHLPSYRDLREHRAHAYSNIHPHDQLLRVTPELFQSGTSDTIPLSPAGPAPSVDWRRVDRIRGAVNAAFASVSSGEQLVHAAALVSATRLSAAVNVPPWFGWVDLDDHVTPDGRPAPDGSRPDHVGFRVAYDVLGYRDVSDAWSSNEVLDTVESRVREAGLAADAAEVSVRNLGRVRSIINAEADFEPFRPSAHALVSAKALLLVLLRQDLNQLLAWPDDETGADDATRVVAAVLAGRLRGLARESIDLRSQALDDLTAAWAVRAARGKSTSLGKLQLVANNRDTSLNIGDVKIVAQRLARLPQPKNGTGPCH